MKVYELEVCAKCRETLWNDEINGRWCDQCNSYCKEVIYIEVVPLGDTIKMMNEIQTNLMKEHPDMEPFIWVQWVDLPPLRDI